ncbi:hypothetical protein A5320_17405 [Rheinheimera sp. SA_1]|nr:hypothetical protein A5320_17405 [Rheinheimera sp. SA_1]
MTGSSDYGVYVTPPGGAQRLLHGPIAWSASKPTYSVNVQPNEGMGTYNYRVYACNYSNYCSYSDRSITVVVPPAPAAPNNVTLAASITIGQSATLSWTASSGHIAGKSTFGVYVTPPGGTQKLSHGPISWSSGQSSYQVSLTPANGTGIYQYRIYACNYDNYCSYTDKSLTVTTPAAPTAPVNVSLVSSLALGQSTILSWSAGAGHISGNSDFGVYVTVPGGSEQLQQGPINWVSGQSSYQVTLRPANGAGTYQYRIYACNYSNYCSNVARQLTVIGAAVVTPTISPNGGTHSAPVSVTLATTTSGAQTRYTVDGSDVTTGSSLYLAPLMVTANTTVKARSFKAGMTDSALSSASFVIQAAAPSISPNGGSHNAPVNVTLTTSTAGAQIRYTINGSDVHAGSTLYNSPFSLSSTTTVKAKSFKAGMADSIATSASFVITAPKVVIYKYDALGRLTEVTDSINGNRIYGYDAAGNRIDVSVVKN